MPNGTKKKYENGDNNKAYSCLWEKAFTYIQCPSELDDLNLCRVAPMADKRAVNLSLPRKDGGCVIPAYLRSHGLTLIDAIHINAAVLAGLIAAFSLRRLNEILPLGRNSMVSFKGRAYLDFNLEKVGLDGAGSPMKRPIPRFLFDVLQAQKNSPKNLQQLSSIEEMIRSFIIIYLLSRLIQGGVLCTVQNWVPI